MNSKLFLLSLLLCSSVTTFAQEKYPFMDKGLTAEQRVNDLVGRMTLEEKIATLTSDFKLHGCDRLGVPRFETADGPLGVASWGLKGRATAFPSQLSLASSWNRDLAKRIGNMYSQEWRARGFHIFYGPGVNIYRSSKDSRNFEYMGEDPFLTAEMAVPLIQGIQDGGIIATVKHFAANDQEFDRYDVSSEVSERALNEIYFPPFKAAVQRGGVKAMMSGYNLLNGVYCAENHYLLTDVLRKQWGYKGMMMSDWGATHSDYASAVAGLDMELGTSDYFTKEKLLPLVKQGKVSEKLIDEKVKNIFRPCFELGLFDRPAKDTSIRLYNPEANKAAYDEACEGIILLKNNNHLLPLGSPKTIAVIGPNANPCVVDDNVYDVSGVVYGGGGSSKVNPWYVVNDMQGIMAAFPNSKILYAEGVSNAYKRNLFKNSIFITDKNEWGLRGKYYALDENGNEKTSNPVIEQVDRNINFNWGAAPLYNQQLGDDYKVEWTGYARADKSDSLTFFVDAQGAYRLWIDDKLVIDESKSQSFAYRHVTLPAHLGDKKAVRLEYWNQRSKPAEIRFGYDGRAGLDFSEALRIAKEADVVVFCGGFDGSLELEGTDRQFELPYGQDQLINELSKVNSNIVVALHGGGGMRMTPWIGNVAALVHLLYPGQEGGRAFGEILAGKVNPSARLPFSIEREWKDSPAYGNYDETRKERKVFYREGIFVGYRGYEHNGVKPLFPFGYGLSYTTFKIDGIKASETKVAKNGSLSVEANITNTGDRAGAEVVQLYVGESNPVVPRPVKELKGFDKIFLNPGETRTISIPLKYEDFAYWDVKTHGWKVNADTYKLYVGVSSADIIGTLDVKVK